MPALRKTRSYSLEPEVLHQVEQTKGAVSASERVNQLLKFGLAMEHKARLDAEIASFFAEGDAAAAVAEPERRAFRAASVKVWTRE